MSLDPTPNFPPQPPARPPLTPPVKSSPLRYVLPAILSGAAVVGLLLVMLLVVLPRLSQVPRLVRPVSSPQSAAVLPPALPAALTPPAVLTPPDTSTSSAASPPAALPPGQAPAAIQAPLLVTLYSAGSGKHVPVGKPVLISAYASLPPAESATIAIAYTRNGGPRSLLTLAQGSLSTASWTPAAPGRYDFTASASDSRKISVFSHPLTIDAVAPSTLTRQLLPPVVSHTLPPVKAASVRALRVKQSLRRMTAARPVPQKRPTQEPQAARASSKAFHVAAAAFVVRPIAETLAGALRRRGFHAFVRVTTKPHHKPMYQVETGDYLHSPDAKKQVETLKHDGYPAFVSQGR